MLRIVDEILSEVVKSTLDICARNERRRRKLALRQKQQKLVTSKADIFRDEIDYNVWYVLERICDRRVSKAMCKSSSYCNYYESASTRGDLRVWM